MAEPGSASAAGGRPQLRQVGSDGDDTIAGAVRRFQASRERSEREDAFRQLYEAFFPAIRRFFQRKGLSPDDALDLTQTTFLRVYKSLDGYEQRGYFTAWLYRVATTTYLKRRRRMATAKRSAMEVSRDALEVPENLQGVPGRQLDGLLEDERRRALYKAVAELPEQMRDCLTLRLYHQLTYREIAVVKRVSVETVKAHLARGRSRLREALGDLDLGDSEDDVEEPTIRREAP
jgi:RNA polymerase sigma-70 factor (ECF subfamily)